MDIALDEIAGRDPVSRLLGIGGGDQRHHSSLSDLMAQAEWGRFREGQVDRLNLATGPDTDRATVAFGLHLFSYDGTPVAVLQRAGNPQYGSQPRLELLSAPEDAATALLTEVRELSLARSVLRGQVVTLQRQPLRELAQRGHVPAATGPAGGPRDPACRHARPGAGARRRAR